MAITVKCDVPVYRIDGEESTGHQPIEVRTAGPYQHVSIVVDGKEYTVAAADLINAVQAANVGR